MCSLVYNEPRWTVCNGNSIVTTVITVINEIWKDNANNVSNAIYLNSVIPITGF